jgi:phage tail-like protein
MNKQSSYLQYLPEIYRESDFTGRFLNVFEKILSGIDDNVPLEHVKEESSHDHLGIEQILDEFVQYFDAETEKIPDGFLEWLAGWVALELPEDWPEKVKRNLIPRIVQLYKIRGTKKGLEEFLNIYCESDVTIDEWYSPFQVGVTSTVGRDGVIGGGPPGFFNVKVVLKKPDIELKAKTGKALRTIIDREKPAHTYYRLEVTVPGLQTGVHSTIGKDTIVVS